MARWVCKEPTVWGRLPKYRRRWETGEETTHPVCPNKHFISYDEAMGFKSNSEEDLASLESMTKRQINEAYVLGIPRHEMIKLKKQEIIDMALEKIDMAGSNE